MPRRHNRRADGLCLEQDRRRAAFRVAVFGVDARMDDGTAPRLRCAITSRCGSHADELRRPPTGRAGQPARARSPRRGRRPRSSSRAPATPARARPKAAIASSSPFFSTKRPTKSTVGASSGAQRGYLSRSRAIGWMTVRSAGAPAAMIFRRISGPSARNRSPSRKSRAYARASAAGTAGPPRRRRTGSSRAAGPGPRNRPRARSRTGRNGHARRPARRAASVDSTRSAPRRAARRHARSTAASHQLHRRCANGAVGWTCTRGERKLVVVARGRGRAPTPRNRRCASTKV